jgi:hypothetical protein
MWCTFKEIIMIESKRMAKIELINKLDQTIGDLEDYIGEMESLADSISSEVSNAEDTVSSMATIADEIRDSIIEEPIVIIEEVGKAFMASEQGDLFSDEYPDAYIFKSVSDLYKWSLKHRDRVTMHRLKAIQGYGTDNEIEIALR